MVLLIKYSVDLGSMRVFLSVLSILYLKNGDYYASLLSFFACLIYRVSFTVCMMLWTFMHLGNINN